MIFQLKPKFSQSKTTLLIIPFYLNLLINEYILCTINQFLSACLELWKVKSLHLLFSPSDTVQLPFQGMLPISCNDRNDKCFYKEDLYFLRQNWSFINDSHINVDMYYVITYVLQIYRKNIHKDQLKLFITIYKNQFKNKEPILIIHITTHFNTFMEYRVF